jgi:hypothetical protein
MESGGILREGNKEKKTYDFDGKWGMMGHFWSFGAS